MDEFSSMVLKGKNVTQKLQDVFFFPVEKRSLFWQSGNIKEGIKILPVRPKFYAIVDMERQWVFSTVTEDYQLITNEDAYNLGVEISQNIFHIENPTDLKCVYAVLSPNRAKCRMDLCRFTDFFQPLMNEGWFSFLSIENSYNKTKCLEYNIGFYNAEREYGFNLYGLGIKTKNPHSFSWRAIKKSIYKELDKQRYNIEWIEQNFYHKIQQLKNLSISKENILPMFCRVFGLTRTYLIRNSNSSFLKRIKSMIEGTANNMTELYGQNAYALLNVFAEFQYQYFIPSSNAMLSGNSKSLGKWVDELIEASQKEDFSLSRFIGNEAMYAADWYRTQY